MLSSGGAKDAKEYGPITCGTGSTTPVFGNAITWASAGSASLRARSVNRARALRLWDLNMSMHKNSLARTTLPSFQWEPLCQAYKRLLSGTEDERDV
jgi:hypothetical protein